MLFLRLRNSCYRAAFYADRRTCNLFCHALGCEGVIHPSLVKFEGTLGFTLVAVAIRVDTSITTVGELEKLVL